MEKKIVTTILGLGFRGLVFLDYCNSQVLRATQAVQDSSINGKGFRVTV